MSSISVRFNSILFFYSIFNDHNRNPIRELLVGLDGLEPSTSRLSGVRSNHLSYRPLLFMVFVRPSCSSASLTPLLKDRISPVGGDDGVRTHDPLLAGQVLSQLSYTPLYQRALLAFSRIFPILKN